MIIGRIEGANVDIAKHQDEYLTLPCRVEVHPIKLENGQAGEYVSMASAWLPTPDEIERINKGAPIILTLLTRGHPPTTIEVGDAPE